MTILFKIPKVFVIYVCIGYRAKIIDLHKINITYKPSAC